MLLTYFSGDGKLVQLATLFAEMDRVLMNNLDRCGNPPLVLLCGDFNSTPQSPIYNFITNGYLDYGSKWFISKRFFLSLDIILVRGPNGFDFCHMQYLFFVLLKGMKKIENFSYLKKYYSRWEVYCFIFQQAMLIFTVHNFKQ